MPLFLPQLQQDADWLISFKQQTMNYGFTRPTITCPVGERLTGRLLHGTQLDQYIDQTQSSINLQAVQITLRMFATRDNFPMDMPQRYSASQHDRQLKFVDTSSKRATESLEKSTNASQFRQTMQMKRYKYQKMAFESKPVSIHSFYEHCFAVEPQSQILDATNFIKEPSFKEHSRVLPMAGSNWIANSKKAQSKWVGVKKGTSMGTRPRQRPQQQFQREMNNDLLINDIKEYFYSMKQYLNNHKRKVQRERRVKVVIKNQVKKEFEERDNLSIVKLKPSSQAKGKNNQKQAQSQLEGNPEDLSSPRMFEHHSTNNIDGQVRSISRETSLSVKSQTAQRFRKPELSIFRRQSSIRQEEYHFIFGRIKDTMTDDEIQKLKALYYHDFIWKMCYNRGFIYECPQTVFRYYVGKGNNSRLVRRIMAKRPWWVEQYKIENAHFVWTQLKVYDAYTTQKTVILPQTIEEKDGLLLTNTEYSQKKEQANPEERSLECEYLRGDKNGFILNKQKYKNWRNYIKSRGGVEKKPKENMKQRNFGPKMQVKNAPPKMTNHLELSRVVGNKKALYRTMQAYFSYKQIDGYLPLTFHITAGLEDEEYLKFLREFYKKSKEGSNCWIVKPGELSNRGRDIKYCRSLKEIKDCIREKKANNNGSTRTYILQSYIERPFLYQGRKFDLRHYLMVTSTQGQIRGYFYQEGYVRTTSYPYSLENQQPAVHLTNDAVQKYLPHYGKFQKANKLSYQQLHEYMIKQDPKRGFYDVIFPQIRQIATDIIRAAYPFIDPNRRANNFEIFGIDVMIDSECRCWLIEVNTNPCIEVNCAVLAAVIPGMLDNAFTIGLDANFLPSGVCLKNPPDNYLESNKFQLVFDEAIDGAALLSSYRQLSLDIGSFGDDDDNYESCEEEDYDA